MCGIPEGTLGVISQGFLGRNPVDTSKSSETLGYAKRRMTRVIRKEFPEMFWDKFRNNLRKKIPMVLQISNAFLGDFL